MKIRVRRFDPDRDSAPRREEFDVSGVEDGESVLGVLQRIRESLDSTLAFRFGCRACPLSISRSTRSSFRPETGKPITSHTACNWSL